MVFQKDVYEFDNLSKFTSIRHGVSTKASGSMKKDAHLVDRDALSKFARNIGITDVIVGMRQIHSGTVAIVENTDDLRIPNTDALITNKKHLPLAVLTADCLPVLLYDPEREVIGAAHAGYKGLLNHIIENTVEKMMSDFQSDPKEIIVGIGPGIETTCYEVGEEVIQKFEEAFPEFHNMFVKNEDKKGKYFLDLRNIAKQCLLKEGILKEHIEVMDICTRCDPKFYSYRGGDGYERFVSVININS